VNSPFDSKEFYELCQSYRHAPLTNPALVAEAFEAVKSFGADWIKAYERHIVALTDELIESGGDYSRALVTRSFELVPSVESQSQEEAP
jgi:predicted metal-binding protein